MIAGEEAGVIVESGLDGGVPLVETSVVDAPVWEGFVEADVWGTAGEWGLAIDVGVVEAGHVVGVAVVDAGQAAGVSGIGARCKRVQSVG